MRYLQNTGGFYEPHITDRIREVVARESVCLDIGANIGVISLALSSLATAGHVYCFEAGSRNHAFLVRNLKINRVRNATALRLAVYDRAGEIELSYVDDFAGAAFSSSTGYGDPRGERETVRCVTIDDWVEHRGLARLDFIKIDVEGAEVKALTGGVRTLSKFQPSLITELNTWCLKEYFGSSAEELFQLLHSTYPNIFVIRRGDGGLERIRRFADLRPFIADEGAVEDLFCTF
jgi:FkbM family methyltransferase